MPQSRLARFASPDHYLHRFEGDDAVFVQMSPEAYRRSIFLDHRIAAAGDCTARLPLSDLPTGLPILPTHWIFHMAHGGSTLLARALGEVSGGLVLREPAALRQVALADAGGGVLQPTLALLSRRYQSDRPTLIKANVPVNFLLPQIAAVDRHAVAVFLFAQLDDYCLAILRSDQHRAWLRNVTGLLGGWLGATRPRCDAELAALLWSAQLRQFAAAIAQLPAAVALDAEDFFSQPAAALQGCATALDLNVTDLQMKDLTSGPLFRTYAKNPALAFDNDARVDRRTQLVRHLTAEITLAQRWIADHAPGTAGDLAVIQKVALRP